MGFPSLPFIPSVILQLFMDAQFDVSSIIQYQTAVTEKEAVMAVSSLFLRQHWQGIFVAYF